MPTNQADTAQNVCAFQQKEVKKKESSRVTERKERL